MGINHVLTSPVADITGTVTVFDSNGSTATANATEIVRPSDWNSAHNQLWQLTGNTNGVSSVSGTNIVLQGGANITLSGIQGAGVGTILVSGGAGAGGGAAISAGTNSQNTGTVVFSNSNGVTFGLDGAGVLTASHNGLTTAMASNRGSDFVQATAAFAGTNASGTIASNGISVSVGNYLTTAMASNRGTDFVQATAAFAGTNASGTIASNGISVSVGNYLTTAALSNHSHGFSAQGGSSAFQTLSFSNQNNVSFSNSAGQVVASASFSQTNQTVGLYAVGNTTGQSSSTTVDARSISYQGAGELSVGFSNGSVVVSANVDAITAFANSNTTQSSSGTLQVSSLNFAGAGGVSVGVSNGSVVISAPSGGGGTTNQTGPNIGVSNLGSTAGATGTVSTGNVVLVGTNGMLLSQSIGAGGTNATISIQPAHISAWANNLYMVNSQTIQPRQSTSAVFPALINNPVSFDHVRFPLSVSMASTSLGTTANTTFSAAVFYTFNVGFYASASSNATLLTSVATTQANFTETIGVSANANGSQYTVQFGITHPTQTGNSNFGSTINLSNASFQISTTGLTQFTGMKHFEIPFITSLPPNMYWIAYGVSSTTSSNGIAGISSPILVHSNWGMSQPNNTWGLFGQANNASIQAISGNGSFTTAGGGTVTGFGFSNVSSSASHVIPYIYMEYDG